MEGQIDVSGVDLVKFVKDVYELSVPRGLGFLNAESGPLPDADAITIVEQYKDNPNLAVHMDYVHGRGCKMTIHREGGRLYIPDRWFDHSDAELDLLLSKHGLSRQDPIREHVPSCECRDCKNRRYNAPQG